MWKERRTLVSEGVSRAFLGDNYNSIHFQMFSEPVLLYRALLRFGRGLKFTDQSYYYRR